MSSSAAVKSATSPRPASVFSSPKRSVSTARTAWPRVALATTAAFRPPTSKRCVRASMLAGVATKASAREAAAAGLKAFITCAMSMRSGAGARCGLSVGR